MLFAAVLSSALHISLLGGAAGVLVTQGRAPTAPLKVTLFQPAVPLPVGEHKGPEVEARREEKPPEPTPPPPRPQPKPKTPKPKVTAPSVPKVKKPQLPKEVVAPAPAAPSLPAALTLPPSQKGEIDSAITGDNVATKQSLNNDSTEGMGAITSNGARRGGGGASARPDYGINPKPPYPLVARRMGAQGVVLLRVHVRADGSVSEVSVARSSGFSQLDDSALQTVRDSWRFMPARLDGVPVASWVEVPIRFVLEDS
jgi:protein TonB